jgi:hypothetical protein
MFKNFLKMFFAFCCLLFAFCYPARAQIVTLDLRVTPLPSPYLSDWEIEPGIVSLLVSNQSLQQIQGSLEMKITGQRGGVVAQGSRELMVSRLDPLLSIQTPELVDWSRVKLFDVGQRIARSGRIPEDEYELCIFVRNNIGQELATACAPFAILQPELPTLITPAHGDSIVAQVATFIWTPMQWPNVLGNRPVLYQIKIAELLTGQTPQQALKANFPFYEPRPQENTFLRVDAPPLEDGKTYVWQVRAIDAAGFAIGENEGNSEIGIFHTFPMPPQPADTTVVLRIVSPGDGQKIGEPSPSFVWEVMGADTLPAQSFRVAVWPLTGEQASPQTFDSPPVWQHDVQGRAQLDYPLDAPELEDGRRYVVRVEALDRFGTAFTQSAPARFTMARNAKIDWELFLAWGEAKRRGRERDALTLLAEIRTDTLGEAERGLVIDAGARVDIAEGPWLQLTAPLAQLSRLANLDFVRVIMLPARHRLQSNAWDSAWDSNAWDSNPTLKNESTLKRAKIRVAILDFGFDLSRKKPMIAGRPVWFRSFRQDRRIEGASPVEALHGAACAFTFMDLLPSAEMMLINFDTELEFLQALRYAVDSLGVRVISCSVSWMQAYDHYDGVSFFSRRIDAIIKDRAVLVAAAGNFAHGHWEGYCNAGSGKRSHYFAAHQGALALRLKNGVDYSFLLSWDDWKTPRVDLDLRLLDASHRQLVSPSGRECKSTNRQGRGQFENPVERISHFSSPYPGASVFYLDIFLPEAKAAPNPRPHFELYVYPPPEEAAPSAMAQSSLASGLATTRTVMTAGSVTVAPSSQGPTNDGRVRPDFCAAGKTQYERLSLVGTSFSAPRVAAGLALILSRYPQWSRSEAVDFLQKFCVSNGKEQKDNLRGWGEIDFVRLVKALTS